MSTKHHESGLPWYHVRSVKLTGEYLGGPQVACRCRLRQARTRLRYGLLFQQRA
ncbi:MAG: hypothetical protein AAGA03_17160 [Planctomycetota bacterium]